MSVRSCAARAHAGRALQVQAGSIADGNQRLDGCLVSLSKFYSVGATRRRNVLENAKFSHANCAFVARFVLSLTRPSAFQKFAKSVDC